MTNHLKIKWHRNGITKKKRLITHYLGSAISKLPLFLIFRLDFCRSHLHTLSFQLSIVLDYYGHIHLLKQRFNITCRNGILTPSPY